ncbi:S-adenosyl-L-methionine-dependent methyltransferase [Gymnopilus junonius]|uniref:S-adenosyl-L-methionine-dependent methyltransferase n=1 Tax=Gymnopilus junonius TaxID=109634 RepID=A0A9P5NJ24_GYMJU|nr:S-adenosyl-L-methionine-dependent methyltransferase [Gymnopilus junonius]
MHSFFFKTNSSNPKANSKRKNKMPSSPARQLLDLISTSLTSLEESCQANGVDIPDLYAPFHPSTEAFRGDPVTAEAANVISAAALQLAAVLTPPQVTLYHVVGGHFKAAAIRACLESNVTEILREAGPDGMHINDIGAKNGQDPQKLGRFLRILAINHIYLEIKPNVFTNTRISSMLDTLKPARISLPKQKHDNTFGLAALASHHLDEAFKASAYAWETLIDPTTAKSGDPDAKETMWQFYERPAEAFRQRRFNIGMQGIQALQPADASLDAFDWKSLPNGAVVVDVGGGVGTSALPLAREFSKLKVVVQDLPAVIKDAGQLWSTKMSDAVKSGRVVLEAQDFFKPQAKRDVAVFFLKQILHDWSDEYCTKILKNLWAAASPSTKLVIMENIMPFACHDPSADRGQGIAGAVPREAPAPLLANYGAVNAMGYYADIDMFLLFNSQERTVDHMEELLRDAGWKVIIIHRREGGDSTFLQSIEAIPISK